MLKSYLRIAVKVLLRRKFYTAVNLLGIAFTLLVLVLATALMDNTIAPGAPETRLARILAIDGAKISGPSFTSTGDPGYRLLDEYARGLPGVEKLSITTTPRTVASFVRGERIESSLRRADGAFWEIMEFDFLEGGPYTASDEESGSFVAVISETTRRRYFGGEAASGRTLRVDDQVFTIVGVVRDVPITRMLASADIWAPISTSKSTTYREALRGGFLGILLAEDRGAFPGVRAELKRRLDEAQVPASDRFEKIEARALTRFEQIAVEFGSGPTFDRVPTGRFVLALVLLAGGFMLLPALNLVNLSLSRILERSSEIGVRKAFGASSWTLVGQFLIENTVLTLVGGAIGFVASAVVLRLIMGSGLIPYAELSISYRVFLAGLGLSLAFAMMAGALPAWRMSRLHPVQALHGRAR